MFVAAIVIPIVFLYFFMLTRKESQKQLENWLQIGKVEELAVIEGRIVRINESNRIFYQQKRLYTLDLLVRTSTRNEQVVFQKPLTKQFSQPDFQKGEHVIIYGQWDDKQFRANRLLPTPNAKQPE